MNMPQMLWILASGRMMGPLVGGATGGASRRANTAAGSPSCYIAAECEHIGISQGTRDAFGLILYSFVVLNSTTICYSMSLQHPFEKIQTIDNVRKSTILATMKKPYTATMKKFHYVSSGI